MTTRCLIAAGVLTLVLAAAAPAAQYNGLIALATCAEAGKLTEKEHEACAKRLDRDDELVVFVNFADKKAYDIVEEDKVEAFIGKAVVITGSIDQGFIDIEEIKPGKEPGKEPGK